VLERLAARPEIESVALASHLPLDAPGFSISVFIEGRPKPAPEQTPTAFYRAVSPETFRLLGIPQTAGRSFTESDRAGAVRVGVINQAMALRYWPGEDPIGERFTLDDDEPAPVEIVGVVGDVRHFGLDEEVRPEFFVAYRQCPDSFWRWQERSLNVVFRSRAGAGGVLEAVRRGIASIDAELPLYNVRAVADLLKESVARRRTSLRLLAAFAAVALLLASVGIYGVVAYSISQRTHEIGIRMALGAQPADVLKQVVRQGAALAGAGVALGVAAALGLTRLMSSLLFDVSATDPATFGSTVLLIGGVALGACYLPARQAASVDPAIALRHE
jgi:putative ABC transport system permease protein